MARISRLTATEAQAIAGQNGIRLKRMLDRSFGELQDQLDAQEEFGKRLNIGLSWTVPSVIISAADVGADVTITIANHDRYYPDGTTVAITGTAFTAKVFETTYGVYYDDETLADTTPTFQITAGTAASLKTAIANSQPGRHFVGVVTTPANGGASTGGGVSPPGGGGRTGDGGWELEP